MTHYGSKNVTLTGVSQAPGLSIITVSRALRQPDTVHADTRAEIQRTVEEIGYDPNLTARSLKSQRFDMIGVIAPILSELVAKGARLLCLSNGASVSRGVAISGFGVLSLSTLLPVQMTTVRMRRRAIGARSAELVMNRLKGTAETAAMYDIGYHFQIREST